MLPKKKAKKTLKGRSAAIMIEDYDSKLDLVVEKIQSLEVNLSGQIYQLGPKIDQVEAEVAGLRSDLDQVKTEVKGLRSDLDRVETEVKGVRSDLDQVKTEVKGLRSDLDRVETEVKGTRSDLRQQNGKIQKHEEEITILKESSRL